FTRVIVAPCHRTDVDAARYRVRILTARNARRLSLELDPGGDIVQVGTDLGLLTRPHRRSTLTLAPAERADVVIDFSEHSPGSSVELVNRIGDGGMAKVMRFDVARRAGDDSQVPERLSTIDPIDPSRVERTRDFHLALGSRVAPGDGHGSHGSGGAQGSPLAMWSINGRTYEPGVDLFEARRGTVERWRITTDVHHPVHAHLVGFQVQQDGAPAW